MKNYRFRSYIVLVMMLVVSCQSSLYPDQIHEPVVIEGELVFKLITLPNLYGVPASVASEFMQTTEDEQGPEETSLGSRSFAVHFRTLEGSGLLHKPYFQLRTKDKETFTVYVDDKEYEKVKGFKYADLRRSREKVELTLKGLFVDGVVDCDEILQVKRTAGLTIYDK